VVGTEHQRRSFSAIDCRTLLDAAALVSSAALGPDAVPTAVPEPEPEPEPAPMPEPEPPAAPTPIAPVPRPEPARAVLTPTPLEPTTTTAARRRGHWLLSARLGAGYDGTLVTPIGSLGLGHAWRRWQVQAQLDALGGRARGPHGALDLRVVTIDPRACAIVRPRARIELLPCAGVAAGPAIGSGRNVPNARVAVLPWAAAHLDFGLRAVPRRWLALGVELSGYAMLARPRFVLSDQRTVYRAGPAGVRAYLTVELRFSATDRAAR
jgi:hypothetical protein